MNDFCRRKNAYFFLDFGDFLFIHPEGLPARIFTIAGGNKAPRPLRWDEYSLDAFYM